MDNPTVAEQAYNTNTEPEAFSLHSLINSTKRIVGRLVLVASLATSGMGISNIREAEASDTGGYVYADAAPVRPGSPYYEWGYKDRKNCGSFCDSAGGHTDLVDGRYYLYSERGYAIRNCTDWVAFRAKDLTGTTVPSSLGNARTWDDNALAGWTKDQVPEPGDIAQSDAGSFGHVGVVETFERDSNNRVTSIIVSQYNEKQDGNYTSVSYTSDAKGIFWRDVAHTQKWDNFIDTNGTGKGIDGVSIGSPGSSNTVEHPNVGDFNADNKTDIAVFRSSDGSWHINGVGDYSYGRAGDIPVPGDYNGDKKTDIAVYRPSEGGWHIRGVGDYAYGRSTDIPVPGDYNGDNKTDIAVYRPSDGSWHINAVGDYYYGRAGDIPVPGYYNDDKNMDLAVYRPSEGGWHIRGVGDYPYGTSTDIPVPGDYNGDGITDMVVYRPSEGGWHIRGIGDYPYGASTDVPVPGYYNTDNKEDIAIYRPAEGGWHINGVGDYPYGTSTDIPANQTLNAFLLKQYGLISGY